MKAANSILDADMATISGWIRSGFAWWVDELRAMVPARLRSRDTSLNAYVAVRGPRDWDKVGRGAVLPVLVDPALCLVRRLTLPPLGEGDLRRLVHLEADRIFPIPVSQLVVAASADPENRSAVTVAALPCASAQAMLAELREAGLTPGRVGLADPERPGRTVLDLTPGLAEKGLVGSVRNAATGWWAVVAFLFLLNFALLVWRDTQQVNRLEALVAEQAPAVNAARSISNRIAGSQRQAQQLASRRSRQDALAILAAVTQALPEGVWVQRYSWDGRSIRLSGYKRQGVDVIGGLRKAPYLADVRAGSSEAIAEVPTGQPFDLTASVRGGIS